MGQAKNNPTALAAKRGELPPKPAPFGKREFERMLVHKIEKDMFEKTGLSLDLMRYEHLR